MQEIAIYLKLRSITIEVCFLYVKNDLRDEEVV